MTDEIIFGQRYWTTIFNAS